MKKKKIIVKLKNGNTIQIKDYKTKEKYKSAGLSLLGFDLNGEYYIMETNR